jgi:hypothetical protein
VPVIPVNGGRLSSVVQPGKSRKDRSRQLKVVGVGSTATVVLDEQAATSKARAASGGIVFDFMNGSSLVVAGISTVPR